MNSVSATRASGMESSERSGSENGASGSGRRSPWPYAIISIFILLFIGGIALYLIANASPSELLKGNAYEDGLKYQEVIEEESRFAERGWSLEFQATSGKELALTITSKDGAPVSNQAIDLYAMRPGDSRLDRKVALEARGPGAYVAPQLLLASGLWILDVRVTEAGSDLAATARVRRKILVE